MIPFIATVRTIQKEQSLHLLSLEYHGQTLWMVSLELDPKIKQGTKVHLSVKPSNIVLVKDNENATTLISHTNQLKTTIIEIENGKILSRVTVRFFETTLEALITRSASIQMGLKVGETLIASISETALSLSERKIK